MNLRHLVRLFAIVVPVSLLTSFSASQPGWMAKDPATFSVLPSPSTAAKNDRMIAAQAVDDPLAIYNGRPQPLTGPPISVFHPVFAEFLSQLTHPNPPPPSAADIRAAYNFCSTAAMYLQDESKRQEALAPHYSHFFGPRSEPRPQTMYRKGKAFTPDGICKVNIKTTGISQPISISASLRETKLHMGAGGCDPVDQGSKAHLLQCSTPEVCPFPLIPIYAVL